MSLAPDTMLGPYRIEEVLGSGGMGEVYRARDTRLDRRVAIKVLAAQFAASEMMRHRFDAEARTVSSLNHPGICHLYDVGHEQGLDFIVMEFLDGMTLAERIDGGPLPTKELLRMAVELTDALDNAHNSGIVHRDLKPGNIMLTKNGAKLMDFGLAKLAREPELLAQTVAAGDSETKLAPLTNPGSAVGTIAYMSPEQARGEALDPRTDLFSLGAVLYECVTGKRAFQGKTSAVVFHAILAESPHPLEEVAPETPRLLVDLIDRLLEKDPDLRPQSAGEVRAWLKRIQRDIGEPSSHATTAAARASSPRYPSKSSLFRMLAVVGFVALLVGILTLSAYLQNRTKQSPYALNLTPNYEQVTQLGNVMDGAAISPDGKYVAYTTMEGGERTIWVRQIASNSAVAVAKQPYGDNGYVSFSPDSQFVFYSHSKTERDFMPDVYVVPVFGGEARKVLSNVSSPVGVSRTGKLAYVKFGQDTRWGLYISDSDGTNERRLSLDLTTSNSRPAWSPDSRRVAISGRNGTDPWQVSIVDVETGAVQAVAGDHHWDFLGSPSWLPDGSGLIASGASGTFRDQLWHIGYPSGEVRSLTNDLNNYGDLSVTISDDGNSLLAVQIKQTSNLWEYSLNKREARRLTSGTGMDGLGGISVAPDGRIFYGTNSGKNLQIWMLSPDGSRSQISRENLAIFPSVSRDGSRIVYYSLIGSGTLAVNSSYSAVTGKRTILVSSDLEEKDNRNADASRNIDLPFEPWIVQDRFTYSLDSKWVYLCTVAPGQMGIWGVPLQGRGAPVHFRTGTYMAPAISPDGRLMKAGMFDEGTNQLVDVVFPLDGSAPPKTILVGPGKPLLVQWTPDGKGLSYIATENGVGNIYFQPWPSGNHRKLTTFENDTIFYYDWAPGERLVVARGTQTSDLVLLTNLRQK
jgi:eukaryotic-like serine/threonine-protein kinase